MAQVQLFRSETAEKIAAELLKTEAVKLRPEDPFQWASGWKSPIYCDNRITLSFPKTRSYIKEQLVEVIKSQYANIDGVIGVATAGIPQGALVAESLGLPFLYVRSSAKKHGMGNQIEGKINPKGRYVMIEDLISTGGSSLKAASEIAKVGAEVVGMLAIFTYGFEQSVQAFHEAKIPLTVLCDYDYLVKHAIETNYVAESQLNQLSKWREDPSIWS